MDQKTKPHILFLFSDTGGGHRAAAMAIQEALQVEFPDQVDWEMVDFFKDYAPPPLNKAGADYSQMAQLPDIWEFTFEASNFGPMAKIIQEIVWPYVRKGIKRLILDHPCDLVISVHPIINPPILRELSNEPHPPYLTVVTDFISTHQYWYNIESDLTILPTEEALERGVKLGVPRERMHVAGMPVRDDYYNPVSKREARKQLGLPQDIPLILLVTGGEGMGPIEQTVAAINAARIPAGQVVIAGKNEALKKRLEALQYSGQAFVKGFTTQMPLYMQACDIIVTKAGALTISEAMIAALPIIIYSKIPGQENGNVDFVVEHGAGLYETDPAKVAEILKHWVEDPQERQKYANASKALGRPDASRLIARTAMAMLGRYDFASIEFYDRRNRGLPACQSIPQES